MSAWRVPLVDEDQATQLATELGVRPLTARLLISRGFVDHPAATRFLSPRLGELRPPEGIADLDRAVTRLLQALAGGEKVGVFGDYDVDGVTTAAVLALGLRALGLQVAVRVAHRDSGYGFSPEDAATFCEEECRLILTGDCGTSDRESLEACQARGVDVIVIDHHQVPEGISPAYALINPHRPDDRFAFKGLASCGVAFYLVAALRTRLRGQGDLRAEAFDPRLLLDLVALGTVADLVPLMEENRILVSAGLRELALRRRPGLQMLAEISALPEGAVSASDVSFRLTPRLNAAGRLGDARRALDLLLAIDHLEARTRAQELDDLNRERQRIQEQVWSEAVKAAEDCPGDAALVLGADGWHPGVVGIVAAKLVERFRRPAVVVGFRAGLGRGSCRTLDGFDLHLAINASRLHLVTGGGHAAAAGVTVRQESFAGFRVAFLAEATRHFSGRVPCSEVLVDAVATLPDLDLAQAEELDRLAPFGSANAEPLIGLLGVKVKASRVVGLRHLQLTLSQGGVTAEAIAFGMGDRDPGEGAVLDLAGMSEVDIFRGYRRTRFRVKHFQRAHP